MYVIKSFTIRPGKGYEITVTIKGETHTGNTFWDIDGVDKIIINGETYELVGISYLRKGSYENTKDL